MELRGLRIQEDEALAHEWAEEICGALAQFHLDGHIGFAATPELALLAARMAEEKNSKLQTSNFKLQRNSKSQAPDNLKENSAIWQPVMMVSDPTEFVSGLPIERLG